uniref:(northern house mosquito) hypothetical protein n=1 Tax=Culex pipiens TaxID=7175 RepID=A0A8D8FTR3_CULPI
MPLLQHRPAPSHFCGNFRPNCRHNRWCTKRSSRSTGMTSRRTANCSWWCTSPIPTMNPSSTLQTGPPGELAVGSPDRWVRGRWLPDHDPGDGRPAPTAATGTS